MTDVDPSRLQLSLPPIRRLDPTDLITVKIRRGGYVPHETVLKVYYDGRLFLNLMWTGRDSLTRLRHALQTPFVQPAALNQAALFELDGIRLSPILLPQISAVLSRIGPIGLLMISYVECNQYTLFESLLNLIEPHNVLILCDHQSRSMYEDFSLQYGISCNIDIVSCPANRS